ncbi:MAG: MmgE/PrpD family protein [Verrucomicrobia bacterium]|nr:MmgE/PrpD family protein [Verrucomicrobiota bacterium]
MNSRNNDPRGSGLSRRSLLHGMGCLIAASALPVARVRAGEEDGPPPEPAGTDHSVINKLSAYMSRAGEQELPAHVAEITKFHILDTLAAMISGAGLAPGKMAIHFAAAHTGENVATVVGSNLLCGAIQAAMVNGMLAHSDETDDSHAPSRSHPGSGIVPAAWAAGEHFGISGARLVRSVALGYDVGTRVTMTLGSPYLKFLNHRSTHQIAVNFGAAAAAACAAGLNDQQMRWVLDYAAEQASGITAWQRDTQHIGKSLCFAGFGARNGTTAALLISAGATGVDDIFTGPDNFFEAFAPEAKPEGLVNKLGERYEVTRTNIKKWTVGSPIQAPLDALVNLRRRRPFEAGEVKKVVVRVGTSGAAITNNREMPDICMQHMVAVMLLDQTASFEAAHDRERMKDPAVLRERAKIQLISDAELEKFFPRREGIVEVTFNDGTTLTERVDDVRGTSENPMGRDEVIAKCRDLIAPVTGPVRAAQLIDSVLDLESIKDIRSLRPLLQVT